MRTAARARARRLLGTLGLGCLLLALAGGARPAGAQVLCDADGDGQITDVDGVNVLRAAASLPSACVVATCDADGDGVLTDVDGVNALRAAASLPSLCGATAPLTLAPASATLTVGESRFYTATLRLEDGTTENVTQRVDYASSDPTVASAPNAPGMKSEVLALAPGVVTISGVDPVSGESSTPGGDATLTVLGPLEAITIAPATVTLTVGEARFFTATGHFGGGGTLNVTQRVDWASSNAAVASAPNEAGMKSRVVAVAPGVATISAVDSETGVESSPDGDAMVTVLGPLESITITPAVATREVGQTIFFTATGHFEGGVMQNITQQVTWSSSDPAVATAPNEAGMKSRVDAVGVGQATISAMDPESGVGSSPDGNAVLTVQAP